MSEPTTGGANRNHLSSDVEIKGTLKFQNDLVFDGKIEGEIQSNATLTVGKSAHVQGEVKSKAIIIHGSVQGNIEASNSKPPANSSATCAPPGSWSRTAQLSSASPRSAQTNHPCLAPAPTLPRLNSPKKD
jgi:hypothetical protein